MKVDRKEVESEFLLGYAKDKDIALISGGDPLTATTHITLIIEARKQNIPVKVIHNLQHTQQLHIEQLKMVQK
jgi:diphthine synthase